MSEPKFVASPRLSLSRRRFIRAAGIALAAPLMTAWAPRVELGLTGRAQLSQPLRLGALLSSSRIYPQLSENIIAGLVLGEREGRAIELARVDLGTEPGLALSAARELIEQKQVAGLLGVLHTEIAARLSPLLTETRTPLWVCEVGANAVSAVSPWITYHTLHYWQAQWLLGDWAAHNLGKKAAIATSLYDSGYDTLFAFRQGFEAAGGEIIQTRVTHLDPRNAGLAEALTAIGRTQPDFVYGLYCGQAAGEFVSAYAQSQLAAKTPLAGSAFMTGDDLLPGHGDAALGILSCLPWANEPGNAEQASLERVYVERTGRRADLFAALGYDAGRLIARAAQRATDALAQVTMAGPRGRLTVDATTRQTCTPLFIREVRRVDGVLRNAAIAHVQLPADLDARMAAARSGPRSGWLNTYLGI